MHQFCHSVAVPPRGPCGGEGLVASLVLPKGSKIFGNPDLGEVIYVTGVTLVRERWESHPNYLSLLLATKKGKASSKCQIKPFLFKLIIAGIL